MGWAHPLHGEHSNISWRVQMMTNFAVFSSFQIFSWACCSQYRNSLFSLHMFRWHIGTKRITGPIIYVICHVLNSFMNEYYLFLTFSSIVTWFYECMSVYYDFTCILVMRMNIYLVFSVFTSRPFSLSSSNRAYVLLFMVFMFLHIKLTLWA
jgi:hypothetical protein